MVATSAGLVGPTPTRSFSWLLGLPYSMNGWVPGEKKKSKRNRQKLFAFYYIALESHNVTFPVCKPSRFRKKHKPLLLVVGLSKSLSKDSVRKNGIVTVVFQKYHLPQPPYGKLDSLLRLYQTKVVSIF